MATKSSPIRSTLFPYFDGCNSSVGDNISKKTELFHVENCRSLVIGTIEKRQGTVRLGTGVTATANYGLMFFDNVATGTNTGLYRISTVSAVSTIYYLNTSDAWVALTGLGTTLTVTSGNFFSHTMAEGCMFLVNGQNANLYIGSDGTTVKSTASTAITNHLYGSPLANKINYFKEKLYLGDYTNSGSVRYKNGIMMSSKPLGLISLIDGDHLSGVTTLNVTDTKYIRATDSLDVYRGGVYIQTLTVSAKTENTLTVTATTAAINSADELWVVNSRTGTRYFRWADVPADGTDEKQYDTFKITGEQNTRIKMMTNLGDNMVIGTNNNISFWTGSSLQSTDLGIGCVSDNGFIRHMGHLWFVHYTGLYSLAPTTTTPQLISNKVQRIFDGCTKAGLEASAVGKKGNSILISVGDVTLYFPDGSLEKTMHDVVLEYNINQQNWYIHTEIKAKCFRTYVSSTNTDKLEFCSSDTNFPIMELFSGNIDDAVTANKEISFRVDTNNITLGDSFENCCYPQQLIVETERGTGIKCFVSLDKEPFYEVLGEIGKGLSILKITGRNNDVTQPPRCRTIRISLRDNSKKICKITRMSLVYSSSSEEENIKELNFK